MSFPEFTPGIPTREQAAALNRLAKLAEYMDGLNVCTPLVREDLAGGPLLRVQDDGVFSDAISFLPTYVAISSNQNNYIVGNTSWLIINTTSSFYLTGIIKYVSGHYLEVTNSGTGTITVPNNDASSSSSNQFQNSGANASAIRPGETKAYKHDTTLDKWREVQTQRQVVQDEGTSLTVRDTINFIGTSLTAADDAANTRTNVTLSQSPSASTSVVGTGRTITAGTGLTGGGDLSADRTIALSPITVETVHSETIAAGTYHDYQVPQATFWRIAPSGGPVYITGLKGLADNQFFEIRNTAPEPAPGAAPLTITLTALDAGSAAANQFDGPQVLTIQPQRTEFFKYDGPAAKIVRLGGGGSSTGATRQQTPEGPFGVACVSACVNGDLDVSATEVEGTVCVSACVNGALDDVGTTALLVDLYAQACVSACVNGSLDEATSGGGADVGCRVKSSGSQTVSQGTSAAIEFAAEDYDTDAMHSDAVNNSRITLKTAGKYLLWFGFRGDFGGSSGGTMRGLVYKNGVVTEHLDIRAAIYAAGSVESYYNQPSLTLEDNFAANDYVEVYAHANGSSTDLTVSKAYFGARKVDKAG